MTRIHPLFAAPQRPFATSLAVFALSLGMWVCSAAMAQDSAQIAADPPDRVARLSYVEGSVSLQPAGSHEWTAAQINRPLTTGDQIWTDQGSRVELELGSAALRLAANSAASFLDLDDSNIQLRLTNGIVNVQVRSLADGDHIEIDSPDAAVILLAPGEYRINAGAGDATVVNVRSGTADVTANGQTIQLQQDQSGTFGGGGLAASTGPAAPPDSFDEWCEMREQRWVANPVSQYVAADVIGAEDLTGNGQWRDIPDYGYAWFPTTVVAGWAPYRFGHWVWIGPWGWTWVDNAAWGFAPFHYGRWAYYQRRWCWVPAPRHVRPIYAPALVAWVGAGVGVAVGARVGADVGWFPLAPGEVYVPGRRVSSHYLRDVNLRNTRFANAAVIAHAEENPGARRNFRNRSAPDALTLMPRDRFITAAPVAPNRIQAPEGPWRGRTSVRAPGIAPDRQSLLGPGGITPVTPPARVFDREVVEVRRPPPQARREPVQLAPPARVEPRLRVAPEVRVAPPTRIAPPTDIAPPARVTPPVRVVPPVRAPQDRRAIPERPLQPLRRMPAVRPETRPPPQAQPQPRQPPRLRPAPDRESARERPRLPQ